MTFAQCTGQNERENARASHSDVKSSAMTAELSAVRREGERSVQQKLRLCPGHTSPMMATSTHGGTRQW